MQPESNVALSAFLSIGVGGPARWFWRARTEDEVRSALDWAHERDAPVQVLGGGSNVVVADSGVDGLVIHIDTQGIDFVEDGDRVLVTAAAGQPWDALVEATVSRGLTGLECMSGIPGRVGATPIQNVGAYGQEVSETITEVRALDRTSRQLVHLPAPDCAFAYRDSRFKSREPGRYIVLGVTYRLARGTPPTTHYRDVSRALALEGLAAPTAADVRRIVLQIRRAKSMLLDPSDENGHSCGSFFVNPIVSEPEARAIASTMQLDMPRYAQADGWVKLSAAWLIERAGLYRGLRQGSVGISTRHCLALVTHPGATTEGLLQLAQSVRERVHERFGIWLTPEPVLWGSDIEAALSGGSTVHAASSRGGPAQ